MIQIEEIGDNELAQIAGLEASIFSDPWSEKSLQETKRQPQAVILGAWAEDILCGYVILYHILDEGEIVRIAVDASCRRRGVASRMLEEVERFCERSGIRRLMLDVRESNIQARAFYKASGFLEDGIRKNFYADPKEDAILMSQNLGK